MNVPGRPAAPPTPAEESRPLTVRIGSLVAGGSGLARLEGKALFVPGTAPGELVEVQVVRDGGDFATGALRRVLEPSPLRRPPPCPHVPLCGGCQWQHLAYRGQLEAKEGILREALRRVGRLELPPVEPIVPSPGEFGYRHRVQLKVNSTGGAVRVGFFASTSHHLVPIRACLIAHPAINALLADAPSFMHRHGIDPSGISVLEFNVDGTGRTVECILHLRRRKNRVAAHGAIAQEGPDGELRVIFLNASLIRHVPVHQYDFTFPSAGGITLHSGAGVFSQNNLDLNPALAAKVLEFVSPAPGDVVADVFCGVGNYSIPLGLRAGRVVAVESNKRACAVGRRNALHHGLAGVEFLAMDAVQALDHLPRGLAAVVINPPRVGAAGLMEGLAALEPGRIVYVSCSPPTLARDMATLASLGYRPARLAPFDMFPQTHHLETVALLERGGRG